MLFSPSNLPEEKLPPERQLAEMFGVNRSTVVRALDELSFANKVVEQQSMRKNGDSVNQLAPLFNARWLEMTPKMETPSLSWQSFIAEEQQEDEAGYKPLRETIQKQMKEAYGLQTRSEQIFITSGAQQALFLITQCLLKPGDAVAIESPSYFYSLSLFQSAGLRIFALFLNYAIYIINTV
ncbi:Uncharacterized HTH-type transcriptional regulator YisV [Listeria monocytogenes N53-1]|nr:Uncharacterized HTH-type transcriptional regulator YisV [Listeria monocytogenes N53-1]